MSPDEPGPPPASDWRAVAPPKASPRDDELLADPPPGDHHLGRFAGYGAGNGVRLVLIAGLVVTLLGTTLGWVWWVSRGESRAPTRQFQLPPGSDLDARPRVFTWSEGKAQLGLSREAPGVDTVELPDRTLRLAPASDLARFRVVVESGRTTALDVLSGDIVEELRPGAAPMLTRRGSPPTPPATAP